MVSKKIFFIKLTIFVKLITKNWCFIYFLFFERLHYFCKSAKEINTAQRPCDKMTNQKCFSAKLENFLFLN